MSGVSCKTTDNCKHGAVCTMTYADDDKKIPSRLLLNSGRENVISNFSEPLLRFK